MKTNYFVLFIFFFSFLACDDNLIGQENENENVIENQVPIDENRDLKVLFAKSLAKVMEESPEVRGLIKVEALKKIDNDYDVPYFLVNNKSLRNGKTLENLLLNYLNEEDLLKIKERLPTLTIFVPELPNDAFSADLWNVDCQIPVVAVRLSDTNDVPSYNSNGDETIIEPYLVPQFPVIVIKENERIVVSKVASGVLPISSLRSGTSDFEFQFTDNVFNNINGDLSKKVENTLRAGVSNELTKVFDAYDKYVNINGWQRDYVYYNIFPDSLRGFFDLRFKECLCGFEFVGDGMGAYNKISDQTGEPRLTNKKEVYTRTSAAPEWTDGEFEFLMKIYIGSTNPTGNVINIYFRAKPQDIFNMVGTRSGVYLIYDKVEPKYYELSIPLFEWDLECYSSVIKISIEEVDQAQTVVSTTTTSSEFATNFEFDLGKGEKGKVGMKYGASAKVVRTTSYQLTTTYGNDELGDVMVNFGDQIITGKEMLQKRINRRDYIYVPSYNTKYSNGWYRIYIAPKKVN